jgi:hypothetical protein
MSDNELAAGLRRLEDRQAILDCVIRAARGLDRHDADILHSAYHPDAVVNIGPFVGSIREFAAWSHTGHSELYGGHTHNITNHSAEIAGDTAHAESYVLMVLRHKDGQTVTVAGGRYIDRLERRNGEWRISLRRLAADWRFKADGSVWNADRPGIPYGTWDRSDISYQRPLTLPPEIAAQLAAKEKP